MGYFYVIIVLMFKCGDVMSRYFRLSYNGIGIYEALKKELWNKSNNPKEEWEKLKRSNSFTWLKIPTIYPKNSSSYFNLDGFNVFMERTYPIFVKYLNVNNIVIEEFDFEDDKLDIVYQDEYQIVIKTKSGECL